MELLSIRNDKTVCARELHSFLGVKTRWDIWVNRRIDTGEFLQAIDFVVIKNERNEIKDFYLSLDMAKHLCLMENNSKGSEARKYFIEVEKQWREARARMTKSELLLEQVQLLVEQEKKVAELAARQVSLEVKHEVLENRVQQMLPDTGFFSVRGYCNLHKIHAPLNLANAIGKSAASISKAGGLKIGTCPDERFGKVNVYHESALQAAIAAMRMELKA